MDPIVRYMILCDDWELDPANSRRINILGLLSNIQSVDTPAYPLLYRELCVFLAVTEGRGSGKAKVRCAFEETGQTVFETPERQVNFGPDPLEIVGIPFRIRSCPFPVSGVYSVQFWYNDHRVAECPLRLR